MDEAGITDNVPVAPPPLDSGSSQQRETVWKELASRQERESLSQTSLKTECVEVV